MSIPKPLPPEVALRSSRWFGRARNYPIYSLPWFRYRSVAMFSGALLVILVFVAMQGSSQLRTADHGFDPIGALQQSLVYLVTVAAALLVGPGLAVLVRRQGWRRLPETAALLAVLLFGMFVSFGVVMKQAHFAANRPSYDAGHDVMVYKRTIPLKFDVDVQRWPVRAEAGLLRPEQARRFAQAYERYAHSFGLPERLVDGWPDFMTEADRRLVVRLRDPTLGTDQRQTLQQSYVELLARRDAKMSDMWWRANRTRGEITQSQLAADRSLDEAMKAEVPPEAPVDRALVRKAYAVSHLLFLLTLLSLLAWLGGLFDLIPFVRQRGMLGDLHVKEELARARAARNDAEVRLSVLAAQVEPHFLFNTLASVRSALSTDPQRAGHIVDHMVDYLRASIPQMRDHAASSAVTLDTQLAAARAYLALMRERMPRLQYSVEAEPGLAQAAIPPLMLISLVENAVKHGVEPKIGAARVDVRARRLCAGGEDRLEVSVLDDGVGFGAATSGGGIGLANIQERLRTQFGEHAALELKARPGGGIAATLRVPLSFLS